MFRRIIRVSISVIIRSIRAGSYRVAPTHLHAVPRKDRAEIMVGAAVHVSEANQFIARLQKPPRPRLRSRPCLRRRRLPNQRPRAGLAFLLMPSPSDCAGENRQKALLITAVNRHDIVGVGSGERRRLVYRCGSPPRVACRDGCLRAPRSFRSSSQYFSANNRV